MAACSWGRYYVIRDGSSIITFSIGHHALSAAGFRIIGAHTDSPSLRVKPNAGQVDNKILRVGVEVYGGTIIAPFADCDLSLASWTHQLSAKRWLSCQQTHPFYSTVITPA